MGERHSGDGPFGRRHAHPGGTPPAPDNGTFSAHDAGRDPAGSGSGGGRAGSAFEARLGAALRAGRVDAGAEGRVVAAFRAARASGAPRARTRRRDDWRPAAPRRVRLSVRATLSVTLASLTLGGVAVAAIGSAESHGRSGTPRPAHPSTSGPHPPPAPGTSTGPGAAASSRPNHPATARDTVAHCRTYERAGERGGALDSTAWQRLVRAAGGADRVAAYCAAEVANDTSRSDQAAGNSGKSGKSGAKSGSGSGSSKAKPAAGNRKPADGDPKGVKRK